jgi:hypothetical protein
MDNTLVVLFPSTEIRDAVRQAAQAEFIPVHNSGITDDGKPFLLTQGTESRALWFKNHGAEKSTQPDGKLVVTQRRCGYGHDSECSTPEGCPGAATFYWKCRASDPP